jgi:preprotein translocase subunit SecE
VARLTEANVNQQPARAIPRAIREPKGPGVRERVVRYLREVWAELKRVDWPSRPELIASTIVVVAVLLAMALYLGAWDALFTWVFSRVLVRAP